MFDIGFSELLLIGVVALIVLGPERLPKAARFAGLWVRRARAQWYSVRAELENELADEELRRSLKATQDELRAMRADLQAQGQALQAQVAEVDGEVRAGIAGAGRAPRVAGATAAEGTLAGDVGRHAGSPDLDRVDDDVQGRGDAGTRARADEYVVPHASEPADEFGTRPAPHNGASR